MGRFCRFAVLCMIVVIANASGQAVKAFPGFIENRGQVDSRVRYYCISAGAAVYFTQDAIVIDLKEEAEERGLTDSRATVNSSVEAGAAGSLERRGCAVYVRFEEANPSVIVEARGELVTKHNYFSGKDRSAWRVAVPCYEEIVYRDVWPGIDLVFRGQGADLEYEVVRYPGADRAQVRFRYEGAERVSQMNAEGVAIEAGAGRSIKLSSAVTRVGRWSLTSNGEGNDTAVLQAPLDNPSALLWSTYLGGSSSWDTPGGIALDGWGNAIVTGRSGAADFPTTPGAYDTTYGGYGDAFVAKLSASGDSLLWSTYLGGAGRDGGDCVAIDAAGNAVVAGWTEGGFPVTPGAYDETANGYRDVFVSKLSGSGDSLLWSTYIGGGSDDGLCDTGGDYADDSHMGIALDSDGNMVVAGSTESSDFPTTPGAYDESYNIDVLRFSDAFVAKISATGSELLWSTYLGGIASDGAMDVVLDDAGNPVLTGLTKYTDFPTTTGAYDESHNGSMDAFVSKLSSTGDSLLWSTYLGGEEDDQGYSITIDASGTPIVVGYTRSVGFPTTAGAYAESTSGASDAFVTRISAQGDSLVWSTYLGGEDDQCALDVAADGLGNVIVTGHTVSYDFPTTPDAYDESGNGEDDAFLAKISNSGDNLLWSSYLGGSSNEGCRFVGPQSIPCRFGLALDAWGNPIVVGRTSSSDFPVTPEAYDTSYNGYPGDIFVAKFDLSGLASIPVGESPSAISAWVASSNPFRSSVNIAFDLAGDTRVRVLIYDVLGHRVRHLLDATMARGSHTVSWDGQDDSGQIRPAGIYFYQVQAGRSLGQGKMILVR